EDPRAPGTVVYTARVGVPRRTNDAYYAKFLEWSERDDVDWANDEDEFCRWLLKEDPDYFAKTSPPFVGYVQFLLEGSFTANQRLTRLEAGVQWAVGGMHQPAKDPDAQRRKESQAAWDFRSPEPALPPKGVASTEPPDAGAAMPDIHADSFGKARVIGL